MEVSGRRVAVSEEAFNECDNCLRKRSVSLAAFGYCIDCYEYYCEDCYHGHRDPKPSRNHKMLEGQHMPKERLCPVDICQVHANETIQYFCKGDAELACQKCAFLKHRMCKNVLDISTLSSDPKVDQRYNEMAQKIASLGSKLDKMHQTRLQNLAIINSNKKQAKTDIKSFCRAIREYLNTIEREMDGEVDQIGEGDIKRMDDMLQECNMVSADLKVVATELEINQDPHRRNQLFIALEKATATIGILEDKLTTLSNDNNVRKYKFEPDERLKRVVKDVVNLGTLSISDVAKKVSLQSPKGKVKPPWNMNTVVAEKEDGFNVRAQTEKKTCYITGCTVMEGDKLLALADENNGSVKLVDVIRKKVIVQIQLSDPLWDITQIQPDQLAVTLPTAKKIQFLTVSGTTLSLGRKMEVSGHCQGIASNSDQLFISFFDPGQVQILNMSGSVLYTISKQADGQKLFEYPFHLTMSMDRAMLYVSDSGKTTVYCLDMTGTVKAAYKHEGLLGACGVSAIGDDSVIVCDVSRNHLHIISSDCKQGRVLVDKTRGLKSPQSVMYSSALSTLFVGQDNSDSLVVFRLK